MAIACHQFVDTPLRVQCKGYSGLSFHRSLMVCMRRALLKVQVDQQNYQAILMPERLSLQ
jgi:hypothetical protein